MSLPSFQSPDSRPNIKDSSGKERTRRRGKQVQALEWGILSGLGLHRSWSLGRSQIRGAVGSTWGFCGQRRGGCTQRILRAFTEVPLVLFRSSHLSCGSSSEEQQHLLSHPGDILGYLGVDPQLLGEKPLLAQQDDIKCSFLGCGQGEQGQALMLSPTAQVELDPP